MSNPTPTPAGWYDDSTGTKTERYWDGIQWTAQTRPATVAPTPTALAPGASQASNTSYSGAPAAPIAPVAAAQRNVLGLVSLAVAVVGFVFACIPGALIIGWVLLPIAFVLSIVALFLKGRGKAFALSALILSIVGTVVGFVVFFAVVANSFDDAFNPKSEVKPPAASGTTSGGPEASDAGDAPAAKTGSRENPAPLGSDIVGREFTVTINSVNLSANDAVAAANEFNDAPDAGMVYALVNATITYMGEDSGYANQAVISYVSADGNVFNSYDKFVSPPEPAFGLDELYKGASVTGNLVIQIPAVGDGLIRVTPGIIADNVFVATK